LRAISYDASWGLLRRCAPRNDSFGSNVTSSK
jgi:hypothetical protein